MTKDAEVPPMPATQPAQQTWEQLYLVATPETASLTAEIVSCIQTSGDRDERDTASRIRHLRPHR